MIELDKNQDLDPQKDPMDPKTDQGKGYDKPVYHDINQKGKGQQEQKRDEDQMDEDE